LRRAADMVQTSELVAVPLQWNKSQISESPEAHTLAETKDRNHQAQHWTRRIFTSISNTALRFTRCTGGQAYGLRETLKWLQQVDVGEAHNILRWTVCLWYKASKEE
jgi:hypothetical protein